MLEWFQILLISLLISLENGLLIRIIEVLFAIIKISFAWRI